MGTRRVPLWTVERTDRITLKRGWLVVLKAGENLCPMYTGIKRRGGLVVLSEAGGACHILQVVVQEIN